jgi:hypothetical protein
LRISEGNALFLNQCRGTLAVGDRKDCPNEPTLVATLGLPDSVGPGRFAIVIVFLSADSDGKNGFVTRYFIESQQGRWILIERDLPAIVE